MAPSITLLLSVAQADDDASLDVVVQLEREARVAELSHALRRYLRSRGGDSQQQCGATSQPLLCPRLGRLAAGDCVLDTDLRSGDIVAVLSETDLTTKPQPDRSRPAVADLVVHAGPQAGRRTSLSSGRHTLGRNPGCDGEIVLSDPSISRRHLQLEVDSDSVVISDLGSSNGFAVEGRTAAGAIRLALDEDAHVEVGRSVISFRRIALSAPGSGTVRDGATLFNRQPRIVEPYRAPRLVLEAAPGEVAFGKLQLAAIFLPIAIGVSSAAIVGEWKLLLSTVLSPATLLWTYIDERRNGRRIFRRSMAQYRQHLDQLRDELELARMRECAARRTASPDAVELAERALQLRPELWERRSTDKDFLSLRIGVSDLPAEFQVDTSSGVHSSPPELARQLLDDYQTVPMVPVLVALPHLGSLGLVGPDRRVDGLGLWLALQAAVLHSPRELSIAAAIDPDQHAQWEWLKWLPHTRGELSPLAGPHLADDLRATRDLLSRTAELMSERQSAAGKPRERPGRSSVPALLLFLDEDLAEERDVVEEILEQGPAVGIYTVWLGHLQRGLPGECRSIAALDQTIARLTLISIGNDERITDVAADAIGQDLALSTARAIASLRDISARSSPAPSAVPADRGQTGPARAHDGAFGADSSQIAVAPFGWASRPAMTPESWERDRSVN